MSKPDIQTVILKDLDTLLKAKSQHNGLNIDDIIEIGAYVGASVLRSRFSTTKEIKDNDIHGVYGVIGNFYVQSFKENFGQIQFDTLLKRSLELLKEPTFDQDSISFFNTILKLKPNSTS